MHLEIDVQKEEIVPFPMVSVIPAVNFNKKEKIAIEITGETTV